MGGHLWQTQNASTSLPAALVRRRNVGVSLILGFAWSAFLANCLSRRKWNLGFFGRHDRIFGLRLYSQVAFDKASEKKPLKRNRGMPSVLPSSVADAKLAEKKAWRRYAEARDDNWREALAEWVEARNALLAAYAEEAASRHRF